MSVIIETSLGDITIDLYVDERPKCCKNFLKLCKIKYYNFCLFHSVQRNFIAQTGDPTGTGKGGESVNGTLYGDQARYFDWEFVPKIKHAKPGLVAMVNNGNNMHGSQFFITLGSSLDYLDGVHTVFGEVTEGLDVVTKLNESYCDEQFKPYRDIRIHHTIIVEDPYDDPPGLEMPDRSPSPTPEVIERARLAADAELDEMAGMTEEEIKEIMEEREEKANAQILEMIGDLPSTDITAPENVLFVCKLNSVTTDEDLEIIFSRFGAIKSCEVIRDHKTGESLQYAFIEFEKKEYCESAYFKMDNVLIDDRRIHVDFSQSVSKFKWKGKGKGVETFNEEPKKPKYIIKDKSKRQDNNYDLVFDDEEDRALKKKQKDRSHDREDNRKKRDNYRKRSRSPLEIKRKDRSHDRERMNERRREDRRDRDLSPRYRGDRHSPVQRHRGNSYKDNRHMSPHRYRDDRRPRESKRSFSPPKHWDRNSSSPKSRERQMNRSPIRSKERREEINRSPIRNKERSRERHYRDDLDEKEDSRKRKKDKKNEYDDKDNKSLERKKKKNYESSDEEENKKRKKKKKRKDDSSDENDNIDKKKKKKKKKKAESSSDEDESIKRKKRRSYSEERQKKRKKSESGSPPHKKGDKYSDTYKEEKHRNIDNRNEKHRKSDRDEYRIRR